MLDKQAIQIIVEMMNRAKLDAKEIPAFQYAQAQLKEVFDALTEEELVSEAEEFDK